MTPLEDLLQQCTVKITVPDGWGTGFFVAPGLILTCAHVVRQAADLQVTVSYPGWQQPLSAIVKVKADDGKTLDLALVELSEPLPDHPCVLFGEEPVAIGQALYSYGYLESYTNAAPVRAVNEGLTGDTPPLLKLQGAQIEKGISGAALLNLKTGKVCGMVKETRAAGFDLGGGAIPTRVILEQFPELRSLQQAFHEGDRRWVNLVTQPGINFQPYLQAILANDDYREWQEVYTSTTVEDRQRMPEQDIEIASQHRFSSRLKLRVETVKLDKAEQGDQDKAQEAKEQIEQWDVLAGLRNYKAEHVVLIGKPGSGKSTSLERLLWEEAEKALQDPNAQIPVLVKLRRCTGTIEALIRDFLVGHQGDLEITQIEELLRQGKFLLLLDSLNELPKAFETEVANFRDRYRRTTPMIVSTRDLGGGGTLGIKKTLKMLPLTEPQMREFVRGYLGEEGDQLFQKLQGDRLRKFAETPLLLWMLCRVFAYNGKVPDNLGLAFREFAQLHDQELQADAPADSKDQWHKLLRHLAFVMMQGKTAIDPQLSIPREEAEDCLTAYLRQEDRANPRECAEHWLQDLLKYHLIQPVIQPNFEEHIEFRHQLIQEYYAAEYLLRLLPNLTNDQLKQDYLNYLKWTEPIALMLALEEKEAQALRVVKLALDEVDLMLGARLASEVKSAFQPQIGKFVEDLEVPDWLKVQLLGKTKFNLVRSDLIRFLSHQDILIAKTAALYIGNTDDEVATQILTERLETLDAQFFSQQTFGESDRTGEIWTEHVNALSYVAPKQTINFLKSKLSLNGGFGTIITMFTGGSEVLMRLDAQEILPKLINDLRQETSQSKRNEILNLIGVNNQYEKYLAHLIDIFKNEDNEDIQKQLVGLIHEFNTEIVNQASIWMMTHPNAEIRKKAVKYIVKNRLQCVQELEILFLNKDSNSGFSAAIALAGLGNEIVTNFLGDVLITHNLEWNQISAARALRGINTQKSVDYLLLGLQNNNEFVKRESAFSLASLGRIEAVPALMDCFEVGYQDAHTHAIRGLAHLGIETPLWDKLENKKFAWQTAAVELIKLGRTEAVHHLCETLIDPGDESSEEVIDPGWLTKRQEASLRGGRIVNVRINRSR